MSCKAALYAANTAAQTVTAVETPINFGTIVRRYGRGINLSGGDVTVCESGYYDVDANFTFAATAAGDVTIALYKDGVRIPGAIVTETVAAASSYSMSIPAILRNTCNCESTITARIVGVAGTIENAAIAVERI